MARTKKTARGPVPVSTGADKKACEEIAQAKKERARAASAACMARKRARLKELPAKDQEAAREADRGYQAKHKKNNRPKLATKERRRRNLADRDGNVVHRLGHLQRPEDYSPAELEERLRFAKARKSMDKMRMDRAVRRRASEQEE
ncbi:hypothetical protein BDZ89DRAFT_1130719 [Hymenopellis radicata]|nr:hypothetical protein BDZ89DRAFT_1043199 [Hymenopellis radicata]KAF9034153.1 hypothetical protein BDZ89DRAFT_1130719 [Hymenopellis radicata]